MEGGHSVGGGKERAKWEQEVGGEDWSDSNEGEDGRPKWQTEDGAMVEAPTELVNKDRSVINQEDTRFN